MFLKINGQTKRVNVTRQVQISPDSDICNFTNSCTDFQLCLTMYYENRSTVDKRNRKSVNYYQSLSLYIMRDVQ